MKTIGKLTDTERAALAIMLLSSLPCAGGYAAAFATIGRVEEWQRDLGGRPDTGRLHEIIGWAKEQGVL